MKEKKNQIEEVQNKKMVDKRNENKNLLESATGRLQREIKRQALKKLRLTNICYRDLKVYNLLTQLLMK